MSEKELLQENERLRSALESANKSRERLRELICAILPVDSPEVTALQVEEMMEQPVYGIEDVIEELMCDKPCTTGEDQQIPA